MLVLLVVSVALLTGCGEGKKRSEVAAARAAPLPPAAPVAPLRERRIDTDVGPPCEGCAAAVCDERQPEGPHTR